MLRRSLVLGLAFLTGCSNAPVAGMLDCLTPKRGDSGPREPSIPSVRPGRQPGQPDAKLPPPADLGPPIAPNGP